MAVLISTHELCLEHDAGPGHPERPARLTAIRNGLKRVGLDEAVGWIEAPAVDTALVHAVHKPEVLDRLAELVARGGGSLDPDTYVSATSEAAARRAAGAGPDLVRRLDAGEADVGWSVVRPPGHHATVGRQMGFCLINNIAVTARMLADRGERVAIVDIDAHHGNGTQEVFYDDPDVLFVSLHQYPWYPFTGRVDEQGAGMGLGTTVNVPLPAGATGEAYRVACEAIVLPRLERFAPTWLLISAGFDGHRADPLADLGLTSADYAHLVAELLPTVPPGRRLLFLEGGYDLDALAHCAADVVRVLVGSPERSESPTSGDAGLDQVAVAARLAREFL